MIAVSSTTGAGHGGHSNGPRPSSEMLVVSVQSGRRRAAVEQEIDSVPPIGAEGTDRGQLQRARTRISRPSRAGRAFLAGFGGRSDILAKA